jgi:signal transduction histidine kinase
MQEALNNVAHHANAKRAAVRLHFLEETLVLEVQDEGDGFQKKHERGLGLVSMRERAELMNGKIEFLNGEKGGALVRVTVPLAGHAVPSQETHV